MMHTPRGMRSGLFVTKIWQAGYEVVHSQYIPIVFTSEVPPLIPLGV